MNGNQIHAVNNGNSVGAYAYNLFGNQVSYTPNGVLYTSYAYRPDGLRHSIGDKVHIWDGANIVADVDGNNVNVYIRGINLIYADDGNRTYYHFNAHGDVVVLTNASGTKTKNYSYNAVGVEYNEATLDENPFRYCGEYYDKETKTIYLRDYFPGDLTPETQELTNLYTRGDKKGNELLVSLVKADMEAAGIDFQEYEAGMVGGYRVALVVNPGNDYHWYRDNGDGTWSHKLGCEEASSEEIFNDDDKKVTITNPEESAKREGYIVFVGYFYVSKK